MNLVIGFWEPMAHWPRLDRFGAGKNLYFEAKKGGRPSTIFFGRSDVSCRRQVDRSFARPRSARYGRLVVVVSFSDFRILILQRT